MFKFFKKDTGPEKEQPKSVAPPNVIGLSAEEKAKFYKRRVDKDSAIAALKAIGKTDEEIERMLPKPLSEAEQKEKVDHIKTLFDKNQFAEVISFGTALHDRGAFTGDRLQAAGWMIGIAAIVTRDMENTKEFAEFAVIGYLRYIGFKVPEGAATAVYMMKTGEELVPGCMHNVAQKVYPDFCDYYGETHNYTTEIKKYL